MKTGERKQENGALNKEQIATLKNIAQEFGLNDWATYDLTTIVQYQLALQDIQLTPKTWDEMENLAAKIRQVKDLIAAFGNRREVKSFIRCYEIQRQFKAISAYPEMESFAHLANNLLSPAYAALSDLYSAVEETQKATPGWKASKKEKTRGGRNYATRYEGMAIRLAMLWEDNGMKVSKRNQSLFVKFLSAVLRRVLEDKNAGAERLAQKAIEFLTARRRNKVRRSNYVRLKTPIKA